MTFRIKKYKDIIVDNPITTKMGVGGEFNLVLRDANGRYLYETGWFPNLITDFGLIQMYSLASYDTYFHIGSSNQAPAVTDTSLVSWLADSSNPTPGYSEGNDGSPDYSWWSIASRRFAAGDGTGTIREVGLSNTSSNTNMVIRALVTPEITKNVDQVLDVYYRFRIYPNLTDSTGQVDVEGELYNWTQRWASIQTADTALQNFRFSTGTSYLTYPTPIRTITQVPDFPRDITNEFPSNAYYDPHGCNGYVNLGLDQGNVYGDTVDGIKSSSMSLAFGGGIQTQYERVSDGKGLFKNNTQTMQLIYRLTWARHV